MANDSNNWYEETGGECYIIDLLRYILDVSVQIVNIVRKLSKLEIIEETLNI